MKRNILLVFVLILVVAGLFHLVKPPEKKGEVIGVLVPLSGPSASIGERVKAGIEVGAAKLQEEGILVTLIFEDDAGDPTRAVSAARKLIDVDDVTTIIGTVKSDAMLAVSPITEESGVVLLSPTAGASAITTAGDFVFRVIETPDIHGQAAAALLSGKRVSLLVANASNAKSYAEAFKDAFGSVTYEAAYDPSSTDFRSLITSSIDVDAFYLAVATAKDAGILVKQLRDLGFTGTIVASVAADAREFFDAAGEAGEGTLITASYFDKTTTSGKSFNDAYRAETGVDGDGFAANGYDAVMLLGRAAATCGSDAACVRDFLYNTRDYPGAGGTLSFDENGDVRKEVVYKVAQNGAFVITD